MLKGEVWSHQLSIVEEVRDNRFRWFEHIIINLWTISELVRVLTKIKYIEGKRDKDDRQISG